MELVAAVKHAVGDRDCVDMQGGHFGRCLESSSLPAKEFAEFLLLSVTIVLLHIHQSF